MWVVVSLLVLGVACSTSDRQKAEETADELARDASKRAKQGVDALRESTRDVADAAGGLSHDLANMFEGTREEVLSRSEKALERVSGGIKKLENEAHGAEGEATENLDKALAEMKKKQQEASEYLAKMKDSTEKNWDAALTGFKKALSELQKSLKEIKRELGTNRLGTFY
jgi:uncharacterized protein YoxC